jgi:CRP/FNR family transcriptional regulator, cyclic AMP receptor protein
LFRFFKRFFVDPAYQQKKEFLRELELFKDLKDRELGYLVEALHTRSYKEGEVIFVEGDIGRALFILESGKVDLSKKDGQGKIRKIFTLEPGDFFGEMALLEQRPRTATAVSLEKSLVHLLYRSKLDAILQYQPHIGISIMTHLARLLSNRLRRASNLALYQAPPTYG